MKSKQELRRASILDLIIKNQEISTAELIERYNVTSETIRKDLVYLESLGAIEKSYGKAILAASYLEKPVNIRKLHEQDKKIRIGAEAAKMVNDGSVIFIDGGSTTLQIAEHLTLHHNVTVVTNSLLVAQCIMNQNGDNEVYFCGGFVKRGAMTTKGPYTYEALSKFKTSFAFMGTNGMLYHEGATCKDYDDIDIKKIAMRQSECSVLLCSSNKFETGAVMQYAKWSDFSYIITDELFREEDRERISKSTKILIAK